MRSGRSAWKRSFPVLGQGTSGRTLGSCGNRDEFQRIADLLKTFYEHGLADLLGISLYLEKLNLDGVMTGGEAYQLVLTQLSDFGLPCLAGLSRSRAPATRYIAPAQEFMNYSMFLEPTSWDRAMTAIENFRKDKSDELPEESVLGPFSSLGELIERLSATSSTGQLQTVIGCARRTLFPSTTRFSGIASVALA